MTREEIEYELRQLEISLQYFEDADDIARVEYLESLLDSPDIA